MAEDIFWDPAALWVWYYEPGQLDSYKNRHVWGMIYTQKLVIYIDTYYHIRIVFFHLYFRPLKFVYTDFVKYFVFPFPVDMIRTLSKIQINNDKQI